ncbi:MAG: SDR family NAD(P)-dependent oxidoreductase [Bacteroidales bacterium]|nr:SDR family NAD(P)-dependent oxidoreductase [Bacteroidales bacterium]
MKKVVLITGAANGLGKALADEFARHGWMVFAADIEPVPSVQPGMITLQMDVTDTTSIHAAYTTVAQNISSLDLLINCAGIYQAYPLSEVSFDGLFSIYSINTFGAFRVIRQFVPLLLPARGRIVSISSESVKFPSLFQPYQATKIALEAIHRPISQELYLKGIRMSLIRPGAIQTGMTGKVEHLFNPVQDSMFEKEFARFTVLAPRFRGRLLSPEKVAAKIYKKVTRPYLRPVYRINNNPLLSLMAVVPERWMMRIMKLMLS